MSGLPRGWTTSSLGEFGEVYCGQSSTAADVNTEGRGTPYVTGPEQWTGSAIELNKWTTTPKRVVPEGCIFITVKGAGVGKMFPGVACAIGRDVYAYEPARELSYPFVMKALAYTVNTVIREARGDIPGLSKEHITDHTVPLPPLAEQKRIVAKLDALNAKSARARVELARIETLVSRYKQAVLSKAFRGELARKDLGDLVARIKAGKNLRCEERPPHPNEKGVVKVSAVTWGEFRADQSKTLPPDFEPDEDTRIKSGDFLFSRANTIELVGAVVIVAAAPDNLYLSDKILRLEFSEPVDAWLLWYLRSPMGRSALMNISSGNQLSMRNIGQKSLLSLSIPYADAELRTEIVRRIESAFAKIDRLAAEAKRALELVVRLDEAILARAFRGELVPQGENDEPAEKLLERIRAERAATPKARRVRGAKG